MTKSPQSRTRTSNNNTRGILLIQEVITNITSAENQAEEIVRDATARAKEIRLKAESEADVILKQAAKDSKDATRLRQNNAEVAAQRKTEMIAREGNKEISDFISKCVVNEDAAVETVKEKLFTKYGNR